MGQISPIPEFDEALLPSHSQHGRVLRGQVEEVVQQDTAIIQQSARPRGGRKGRKCNPRKATRSGRGQAAEKEAGAGGAKVQEEGRRSQRPRRPRWPSRRGQSQRRLKTASVLRMRPRRVYRRRVHKRAVHKRAVPKRAVPKKAVPKKAVPKVPNRPVPKRNLARIKKKRTRQECRRGWPEPRENRMVVPIKNP